jgi:hypothetical protein
LVGRYRKYYESEVHVRTLQKGLINKSIIGEVEVAGQNYVAIFDINLFLQVRLVTESFLKLRKFNVRLLMQKKIGRSGVKNASVK